MLDNVTPHMLLASTMKLLAVNREEDEDDDRDSLANQQLWGPEDFFAERIEKDDNQIGRQILWQSTNKGKLHVRPGALSPQLETVLLNSGVASPIEEINPIDIADQHTRVTRMGDGGIGSETAIPEEARQVQASYLNFIDPLRGPESGRVGVDLRATYRTFKGDDGQMYADFVDKAGQPVRLSAVDAAKSAVAFPGEFELPYKTVRALVNGRLKYVPRESVQYTVPHVSHMFNQSMNLVPLFSASQGNRPFMAGKLYNQTLAVQDAESPLVQTESDVQGKSFYDLLGEKAGAVRAQAGGTVVDVDADSVKVKQTDGTVREYELYNEFPLNRKTYLHNTAVVQVGDKLDQGALLAKSNYTDDKGRLAIGKNLRVAFMPYKGTTYEDEYTVRASVASRMTSEHMMQKGLDKLAGIRPGFKSFVSLFPKTFEGEQLEKVGDDGIIKPGQVVRKGDPLILALGPARDQGEGQWMNLQKASRRGDSDRSVVWDHDFDGVVTDVVNTDKGINVAVKAYVPLQEGDKISGMHGDKGVVAHIVADSEMLVDEKGDPYDVVQNPATLPSRMNDSQLYEMALGKIAKATGKEMIIPNFTSDDWNERIQRELRAAGLKDKENVFDPIEGRTIKNVNTGYKYYMKAHHTSESKADARAQGGYTSEGLPTSGGHGGGKTLANLGLNAILAHGATDFLRDTKLYRASRNDKFWDAYRKGITPPPPEEPLVYKKFLASLQGAGINIKRKNDQLHLSAMTDKDVDELTGDNVITSPDTLSAKDLQPMPHGLFDRTKTGGVQGQKWARIELPEPMPNPVMEEPIRRLLKLTQQGMLDIISGEQTLGGKTGGAAIQHALSKIDLDTELAAAQQAIIERKGAGRDDAIKRYRYLHTCKEQKMHPRDFMITRVPVLPPVFRPITPLDKGGNISADANYLYADLLHSVGALKEVRQGLGEEYTKDEKLNLYNSLRAVTGIGDPVPQELQNKQVGGLLTQVFGKSAPKHGLVQRRVIGMTTDFTGRGVIKMTPDLKLDEIGLPVDMALESYRTFILRNMVRKGMPAAAALKHIEDKTPAALDELQQEMSRRPVVATRAPVLSKFGMMGFHPVLIPGKTIGVNPLVAKGYVADNDGDAQQTSVTIRFVDKGTCVTGHECYNDCHLERLDGRKVIMQHDNGAIWRKGDELYVVDLADFPNIGMFDRNGGAKGNIDFYVVPDGVEVLTVDAGGQQCWARPTAWSVHRDCQLEIVTTANGYQLFTDDDPRAVLGVARGEYEMKRFTPTEANLQSVMIPRQVVATLEDENRQIYEVSLKNVAATGKAVQLREDLALTRDVGYVLGVVCGDGWASQSTGCSGMNQVHICGQDKDIFEAFNCGIAEFFPVGFAPEPSISERTGTGVEAKGFGDVTRVTYSSRNLADVIHEWLGHRAGNKHLPPFWASAPREFRMGLLGGLIDTDGSIAIGAGKGKKQLVCNFTSISLRLAREVRLLANSLGIRATVGKATYRSDRTAYVVTFSAPSIARWGGDGMHCARKRDRIAQADAPDANSAAGMRHDLVPFPAALVEQLSAWVVASGAGKRGADKALKQYYNLLAAAKNNRRMPRVSAQRLLDAGFAPTGDAGIAWRVWVADTSIAWEEVVKVEKTGIVETLYDLTVPDHECFFSADGLLVSNTFSFHVPVTNAGIQNVLDKMLPSKNLFHPRDQQVHQLPNNEYLYGLDVASRAAKDEEPRYFASTADVQAAFRRNEMDHNTPVIIGAPRT